MSSEQEKSYNQSDNEERKKHGISFSSEEKAAKSLEDLQDMKPSTMRFFQGIGHPPPMMQRPQGDIQARPAPIGAMPRGNLPEDSDLTDAMVFLNKIKEEYSDALPVYDSFLETMRDFKFGKIDADEVCKAVRILFKDKAFLVRLFDEYLPHHLRFNDGRSYNPLPPPDRHKFQQQYRMPGYMNNPRLGPGHPAHAPPFIGRPTRVSPSLMQPQPPMPPLRVVAPGGETPKHRMANDFIQLVKKKYATKPIIYKQFIELLQNSKSGFDKLLSQVSALLNDSPELVERFEKNFRPTSASEMSSYTAESDPLRAVKDVLAEKGVLEDFLKIVNFYNQDYIGAEDLLFMLEPIIRDQEHMRAIKAFIHYTGTPGDFDTKKLKDCEQIGSYKIFPQPQVVVTSSALARELINGLCISVSTHDSEEDTYVFRNKNSSEELLARVGDERSESDLSMDRLRYLICKLEELYAELDTEQLEMDDIEMSAALIKEALRRVYESKSNEVLEAILGSPRKAIPVVLSRLHKVYKENLAAHRERRKFWRALVEQHYFKAYDTKGVTFKSNERNMLALRHIQAESHVPFCTRLDDTEIIALVHQLFALYVESASSSATRRVSADEIMRFFEKLLADLQEAEYTKSVDFDYYALCLYVCTLYARFKEVRSMEFQALDANKMAVDIDIQEDFSIIDRYANLIQASEELASKAIDADEYEDRVRLLTDSKGYRLYNLRKILSRIEKQVILLIERQTEDEVESSFGGKYAIDKKDGTITMCIVEDTNGSAVDVCT